jgi:hypothetical protein
LVLGATAVIRFAQPAARLWLLGVLARKPGKLGTVALANTPCTKAAAHARPVILCC